MSPLDAADIAVLSGIFIGSFGVGFGLGFLIAFFASAVKAATWW